MNSNIGGKRRSRGPPPNVHNRGQRLRQNVDKSLLNEGIYANVRLTHAATSLIGCVVQVQVKNGRIFEGIFKTFSPKMEIVLEMAHKVEDTSTNVVPSKDRLIETVIFQLKDIVMLTSVNVDLDYASKDSFTDSAISSKVNGPIVEKELQPWEGDGPGETLDTLDSGTPEAANGWDPNEMFKTNAEQYGVVSSYDPSLSQYTTPLKPENTKEFREREARAAKLANEIEKSDQYKARIALENGDGDDDEEAKFSAVVRPGESSSPANNSNKYVPPHLRKSGGYNRPMRPPSGPSPNHNQTPPVRPQQTAPLQNTSQPPADGPKLNGGPEKEEKEILPERSPSRETSIGPTEVKHEKEPSPTPNKEHRKSATKTRYAEIEELKEFGTKFKLSEQEVSEKEKKTSPSPQGLPSTSPVSQPVPTSPQPAAPPSEPPLEERAEERKSPQDEKIADTVKKSTLNPNAKEFTLNPNAKPFTPTVQKHPMQVPTPPRPATQQSPSQVMIQTLPVGPHTPIHGQHMYPAPMPMVPVSMPHTAAIPNQQTQRFPAKRVVVSVQHRQQDYNNPAAQAAAATGQPLLAQPNLPSQPHGYMQYIAQPMMGPGGTVQQMVPMQAQPRMMAPPAIIQAHQGHEPSMSLSQQQAAAAAAAAAQTQAPQAVFMTPGSAVPAHLPGPHHGGAQPHPHVHPAPAHIAPHHQATPPHSQPSHINSQSAGTAHPAPSPVQHPQQTGGHGHGPPHPPTSGTPQPHLIYQPSAQMSQQGHPPLQPSPHTPTSPQSMHPPPMTYTASYYTTQAGGPQAMPQMTLAHTSQPHTTVTHAQHNQHSHPPHPQIMMMPQHPAPHGHGVTPGQAQQLNHAAPPQLQHAHHIQGPPMQGRAPMHGQAGPTLVPQTINVTTGTNIHHPQMQFMPHHQMSQSHPPPMQAYQHNQ